MVTLIEIYLGYLAAIILVGLPAEFLGMYIQAIRHKEPWQIVEEEAMRRMRKCRHPRTT